MQALAQFQEGLVDGVELAVEAVLQGVQLGPIGRRGRGQFLQRQDLAQPEDGHRKALGEALEFAIEAGGEG